MDIFVGTTGRVLDHIERGNIDFSHIKTIILDEADQMLKLGFKEDVERVRTDISSNVFYRLCPSSRINASKGSRFVSSQLPSPNGSRM